MISIYFFNFQKWLYMKWLLFEHLRLKSQYKEHYLHFFPPPVTVLAERALTIVYSFVITVAHNVKSKLLCVWLIALVSFFCC
jgi:hypothetical protein